MPHTVRTMPAWCRTMQRSSAAAAWYCVIFSTLPETITTY